MTDIELKDIYISLHPVRYRILKYIKTKPSYPTQIEKNLKIQRALASFHLRVLKQKGIVTSKFGLKKPPDNTPKAVKYFHLTDKGKKIFSIIKKIDKLIVKANK